MSAKDRTAVTVAYLICRAIDTIEDSTRLSVPHKKNFLQQFSILFKEKQTKSILFRFKQWGKTASTGAIGYESILLKHFDRVMQSFFALPPHYQLAMKIPVLKMAKGMQDFIEKYQTCDVAILKDEPEMEAYCYFVAGTIGEFLTDMFLFPWKNSQDSSKYQQINSTLKYYSRNFGLALQRINIAKDCFKDQKRGWTYLPLSFMEQENITAKEFLSRQYPQKCRRILYRFLDKTDVYLKDALNYTLAIPRLHFRHRLFCVLPLLFAVKTSRLLRKQDFKTPFSHKISRFGIYSTVLIAYVTIFSNLFTKTHYHLSKNYF